MMNHKEYADTCRQILRDLEEDAPLLHWRVMLPEDYPDLDMFDRDTLDGTSVRIAAYLDVYGHGRMYASKLMDLKFRDVFRRDALQNIRHELGYEIGMMLAGIKESK